MPSSKRRQQKRKQQNAEAKPAKGLVGGPGGPIHFSGEQLHQVAKGFVASTRKMLAANPLKNGWFGVDSKGNETDLFKKEFSLMRQSARAMFGNRPIRFLTPTTFIITTTVTSGVTQTVDVGSAGTGQILPSGMAEWSSLSALFDEVKVHGGVVDFIYDNPVGPTTNSKTVLMRPVIAFDPSDSTVLSSTTAGMEMAQHKTLPIQAASAALGSNTAVYGGIHHKFAFRVPPQPVVNNNGAFVGDAWQAVNGTPTAVGAIKFYHVGSVITAINTGAGHILLDVSFRCKA